MSIPMQLLLVVAAVCVCFSDGAPDGRIARAKQQRPTRGFKNLEMMTARGFGKRGRPSTRTEREVRIQGPMERSYRTPTTFINEEQAFAYGPGKRTADMEPKGEVRVQGRLQRTYRTPTFVNEERSYAYGHGKRTTEMEPEGEVGVQEPMQRIYRTPTFVNEEQSFAYGPGKRTTEMEPEANVRDRVPQRNYRTPKFENHLPNFAYGPGKRANDPELSPLKRTYKGPTFRPPSPMFAYGNGKRTTEMEPSGAFEDELIPERNSRATQVFKNTELDTAMNYRKRTPEIDPEAHRRYNPKSSMMVATDFGKRSDESAEEDKEYRVRKMEFTPDHKVGVASGYGKRMSTKRVYGLDNFWETLASPERQGQEVDDDKLESIPMDWFVNEIVNNPDFARSVLRKFVDINQDGMLSSDELLRNV